MGAEPCITTSFLHELGWMKWALLAEATLTCCFIVWLVVTVFMLEFRRDR